MINYVVTISYMLCFVSGVCVLMICFVCDLSWVFFVKISDYSIALIVVQS